MGQWGRDQIIEHILAALTFMRYEIGSNRGKYHIYSTASQFQILITGNAELSESSRISTKGQKRWFFVLALTILQNAVAAFAVYSSSRDVLSDGACIGGVFGTLANMAIFIIVLVWSVTLAMKSLRKSDRQTSSLNCLFVVGVSSALAILIGQYAALRCTV
jgi:uncharacterized membrane protein